MFYHIRDSGGRMYGFHGKTLRIDLTTGRTWVDAHDETFYRR